MRVTIAVALVFVVSSTLGVKVDSLFPDLRLVVPSKELGNLPEYETRQNFYNTGDNNAPVSDERIVNGALAVRGQFPYQAAIIIDGASFCGGSLISTTAVLTAAHCAQGASFEVHLGALDISLSTENGRVTVTTKQKTSHPDFNPNNLNNDIAILTFANAITPSTFISPVRLPRLSDVSNSFAGNIATVSGWGRYDEGSPDLSNVLRYVQIPVISNTECSIVYNSNIVTATTLCCSGDEGKSTCNGDSGGPLVYTESDGRKTQIGVASFVSSVGCTVGSPSGYVRITSFLDWIATNTGLKLRY